MNLYNEYDPKSANWLRNLIAAGEIPQGIVDERSIVDLDPDYCARFTQCHFFAGIGGWSYALRLAHWPRNQRVWTGSCPCQPFSVAGKGEGLDDERHLWPAFRWLISKCRPAKIFGEQVASEDGRDWASGVRDDLEVMGYDVGLADLCAPGVGADHIRQRLYWGACRLADHASNGRPQHEREPGRGLRRDPSANHATERGGDPLRLADRACQGLQERRKLGGVPGLAGCFGEGGSPVLRGEESGLAHRDMPGHGGSGRAGLDRGGEPRTLPAFGGGVDWSQSIWWPCRDGKLRRVPARRVGNAEGQRGQVLLQPGQPGRPLPDAGRGGGPCGLPDHTGLGHEREPGAWGRRTGPECPGGYVHDTRHDRLEVEPRLFPLADGVSGRVAVVRPARCGDASQQETRWVNRRAALFGAGNAIVPELAARFVSAFEESIHAL